MRALEAPQYRARNIATGDLLRFDGQVVVGTYTWVASELTRLVSEANRPAYIVEIAFP